MVEAQQRLHWTVKSSGDREPANSRRDGLSFRRRSGRLLGYARPRGGRVRDPEHVFPLRQDGRPVHPPARSRPCVETRGASAGSLNRRRIADTIASASFGGTSRPSSPSRTRSGIPPTLVLTTHRPQASASSTLTGALSTFVVFRKMSPRDRCSPTALLGIWPGNGRDRERRASEAAPGPWPDFRLRGRARSS